MSLKTNYVKGLILVEELPDKCRCGGTEFDFEEDKIGTSASCKDCRMVYATIDKSIYVTGDFSG